MAWNIWIDHCFCPQRVCGVQAFPPTSSCNTVAALTICYTMSKRAPKAVGPIKTEAFLLSLSVISLKQKSVVANWQEFGAHILLSCLINIAKMTAQLCNSLPWLASLWWRSTSLGSSTATLDLQPWDLHKFLNSVSFIILRLLNYDNYYKKISTCAK